MLIEHQGRGVDEPDPRVHVLYKRPEIPANTGNPAFANSVTYRKRENPANTGSILVSATIFPTTYERCAHTRSHSFENRLNSDHAEL